MRGEIIRWTIEEAEGRYGLKLHGRVEDADDGCKVVFVCLDAWREIGQHIPYEFLASEADAKLIIGFLWPALLRPLAEAQDSRTLGLGGDGYG